MEGKCLQKKVNLEKILRLDHYQSVSNVHDL